MSLGGVKQRLLNEIISLYFGEPSATIAEIIERCGPCPIGLVAQMSNFPLPDVKTIVLSLYSHGVVSVSREGSQTLLTVNSLPAYILSAPSLLLEQIEEQYQKQNLVEAVRLVLLNGIVEFIPSSKTDKNKKKKVKSISPLIELPDDFESCVEELIEAGIFNRRIVECESFTTTDVFAFERRIENLNLIKKKTVSSASTADFSQITDDQSSITVTSENPYSITINWNGVAAFLRGRYICNFSQVIRKNNEYLKIIESILCTTNCSDYTTYKNSMMKDDDSVRTDIFGYPRLEFTQLASHLANEGTVQSDALFNLLDGITDSGMNFLKSGVDGSYWDVTTPQCIRTFQLHHIEMYLEQILSKNHRRCFNEMRELITADTQQIEYILLPEQNARNSIYELCRLGFVQMQGIPKNASDKMINQRSIFVFRYDEEIAIEAYRLIIGEHTRRLLDKIAQLHKEFEQNQKMETGNMTAAKANEKKEKHLCAFSAQYANAMKTFILFAEM